MKKNLVRIVAAMLVALLALTLIPLGALADDGSNSVGILPMPAPMVSDHVFDKQDPDVDDLFSDSIILDQHILQGGEKLKADDYEDLIDFDGSGDIYEFRGFANAGKADEKIANWIDDHPNASPNEIDEIIEKYYKETELIFKDADIKIPDVDSSDPEKLQEFYYKYGWLIAGYTPHDHKLSRWYSDGTTHWRECLECKEYSRFHDPFMYQNWCQDGDGDRICNVCGGDVPYHDVTVIETEGGKITVNKEEACHRTKITADVETNDGYTFEKLHFTKVRTDGSEQEITRYKKNGQFWTYMPTYDLEVSAEFTKN